jgi:hypothetical protein
VNRGLIKILTTPMPNDFVRLTVGLSGPPQRAPKPPKYLVRLAPPHMIIWKNSFSPGGPNGVSDFPWRVSGFDRAAILKPVHRVSSRVRRDESLAPEPAMSGSFRRMILLDAPAGLFGPSRQHRNCPKYLAYLPVSQLVTRESLAQEILLSRPCQTFRR